MTLKQRLQAVFDGSIPDKVPHFEFEFQLEKERGYILERYFSIWEMLIERYNWSAIQMYNSMHGFFDGKVIPEGKRRFGDKVMIYDFNGINDQSLVILDVTKPTSPIQVSPVTIKGLVSEVRSLDVAGGFAYMVSY